MRQGKRRCAWRCDALNDLLITIDKDGGGKPPADGGLGQRLAELLAITVEQWLVVSQVDHDGHDIAAERLCVFAQIGLRDVE